MSKSILLIIPSLKIGGAEKQLTNLVNVLSNQNHINLTIVVFYKGGRFWDELIKNKNIKLISFDRKGKYDFFFLFFKIFFLIKKYKYDIVQTILPVTAIFGILPAYILRVPLKIINVRCSYMNWKEYSFGSRVYFWFEKIMSFLADKIIYNSFAGKTYHENYGYCKKNGIVIWNGFDTTKMLRLYKEFDPLKLKAELGLVPNKKIISIIARVDNMKDHFTALKAIKKLLDNNIKDFVLLVIGDGNVELKEKLNNYVDKNQMNDYVLFLGMKNDIIPYYKITDILLSSSCFGEGVSNSIVEAMLFEKIIIATDVGDNSILINKERGYLFNVKDYNKLYEILKSLIKDDSNLNKDCLKKYVLENLNLNFMVNRYISEWSIK